MEQSFYYRTDEIPENILKGMGTDEEIIQILKPRIFTDIKENYCGLIFHITNKNGGMYIKAQKGIIKRIKKSLQ